MIDVFATNESGDTALDVAYQLGDSFEDIQCTLDCVVHGRKRGRRGLICFSGFLIRNDLSFKAGVRTIFFLTSGEKNAWVCNEKWHSPGSKNLTLSSSTIIPGWNTVWDYGSNEKAGAGGWRMLHQHFAFL